MHGRTWLRGRTDGAAVEPPLRPTATLLAALAGLLVLTAAPPAAAQTTIDDFSTAQALLTDPPGGASSVPTAGADILGMHRDLTIDLGTGAGPATVGVGGGLLIFTVPDTTPDSEGSATVTWDGDTDPNVLAPTGLGGVDLTTGGASALRIRAGASAAPVSAVVQVYTDAGNVSRAGLVIPVGAAADHFISFAAFVAVQGTGADFTDVGAVTLKFSERETSVTVDLVDAVNPELAAAKADALTTDVDVDTRVDPGDTLTYTITLTNTGGEATTVSLADVIDPNTTLVGTPRTSPIAADDQYTGFSAMPIDTAMSGAPGLLDNDADVDGDPLMAVAATGQATTRGGSVDVAADGDFVYIPPVDFFGVDSFAYTLQAVGGDPTTTATGSPIGTIGATAYVVIEPIPPTVTAGGTLSYTEGDAPTAIDTTITVTDPDSPNLAGATAQITGNYAMGEDVLSFTDMLGITGVFSPATGTMTLSGTAPPASYETALRSVKYENTSDDPSTSDRTVTWIADDGFATSAPVTSGIQITAVNDPPVLTAGGTLNYTENDPPTAIDTTITATDPDSANLQSATAQITVNYVMGQDVLSFTDMLGITGVFTPATGTMTLTGSSSVANYQTALKSVAYSNTSENPSASPRTVTWIASDGALSSTPVFSTITVTPVNDPPVAGADSWDTVGNTRLVVDLPPLATPHVRDTTASTFGVLDNDADPAENNAFAVTGIVGCADLTPPFGDSPLCATTNGGSVVMEANGRFTYTPPVGTITDDMFMYTVTDDGAPPASSSGTVTIKFFERVWYVENDSAAGGLGRSHDPFDTLVEAQTASVAGDWIFVHFGDGTSTGQAAGVVLKAGQHLLGEHAGLSIPVNLNGNGTSQVIFPAAPGNRPRIDHSGAGNNAVSATDAIPTEIIGLSLQSAAANAVDLTLTGAFSGSGNLTILNNEIRGAGAEGIDVNAGGTGTLTLAVSGTLWNAGGTHTGNAVDVARTAGTLRLSLIANTGILSAATAVNVVGGTPANAIVTGFANNTVHQNTGGHGILVGGVTFDADPGSAGYQQVAGGTTAVGVSGDGVGGVAMTLGAVAGDLAFTDLDLFGTSGLTISGTGAVNVGAGTGTRVTVGTGMATINATGGPAVVAGGVTLDLQLAGLTSSGSATNGVSLVGVSDAASPVFPAVFSAPSGSSIAGAAGTAFDLDGGNATVTYNGTITNTAGRSVAVQNRTGDTATFTGGITDSGTGILVNANAAGVTTNFQGGLSLSTGANAAFTATSGGTLSICDENPCNPGATGMLVNTLTTTTGTALNVTSTTISANNLEFRSISSNGGSANGIILSSTGANGGLKVKGTGTAGSGGTIQNKTGANGSATDGTGIYLSSTSGVSLDRMQLNDFQNYAIRGLSVTGFSLTNSVVNGANGTTNAGGSEEDSIRFDGLFTSGGFGTAQITDSTISGGFTNNLRVRNVSGTLNRLMLVNNTFGLINAANGNDNVAVSAVPPSPTPATLNVTLQDSNFLGTRGDFFETIADGNSTMDVVARRNKFTNGQAIIPGGGVALSIRGDVTGTADNVTFDLSCNNVVGGHTSTGIFVAKGNGGGTWSGAIVNNPVGAASGAGGDGIFVRSAGSGSISLLIQNNQVTGYGNVGFHLQNNDGSATMNATIFGNTVTAPHANAFAGLFVDNGATATDTSTANVVVGAAAVAANKNDFSAGDPFNFSDVSLSNFSASTTFNLSRNGSANSTAAQIIDDDNLNPANTNTDTSGGAGAITAVNTLPTVPATPAACSVPP